MKNKNHIEPQAAQAKISRKLTEKGEISTNTDNMQVDNQATNSQQDAPKIDNQKRNGKEDYYFTNSENPDANSSSLKTNKPDDSDAAAHAGEELNLLDNQTQPEQTDSQAEENDSIDESIEDVPDVYFLQAKRLFDCKNSQKLRKLAIKTIKNVHHNNKTGWLLIGIAAYRVLQSTAPLPGGWKKTDDLEIGRVSAMRKFAQECADNGVEISYATLYDYTRWVKVLLEEPLEKFADDKETLRHERTVLMEKLFTFPPSFAKTLSTGTAASEKLAVAIQLEDELGRAARHKELQKALKEHFKNKIAGIENGDNESGNNKSSESDEVKPEDLDSDMGFVETGEFRDQAKPVRIVQKFESSSNAAELFARQINNEAERVKLEPEQVKDLYVAFLQMILSSVQDMGVKK